MTKIYSYIFYIALIIAIPLKSLSQNSMMVSGEIIDSKTHQKLPFASIGFKNQLIGTVSNFDGQFSFKFSQELLKDTLQVSFVGYKTFYKKLTKSDTVLVIELESQIVEIEEVTVLPFKPVDYIRKAVEHINVNYPTQAFLAVSYFKEEFTEDGRFLNKNEAVFRSWFANTDDTLKNQHQLLLYRKCDDEQKLQFMSDWIKKKQKKAERKEKKKRKNKNYDAKIDSSTTKEPQENTMVFESDGENTDISLGGPELVLSMFNFRKEPQEFLDTASLDLYDYWFGELKCVNEQKIQTINFKSKKKIDHITQSGKILVNIHNFAIEDILFNGKITIPWFVRPILFAYGIKIEKPFFHSEVHFQNYKGKYYPKYIRWEGSGKLKKRHLLKKNEQATFKAGQVLVVNKIETKKIQPIPKTKRFKSNKAMKPQVHNDKNITWKSINTL